MQPQNWRNRDERLKGNQNEPSRWDRDQEMEGRWAERNLDDDRRGRRDLGGPARGYQLSSEYEDFSTRGSSAYDDATARGGHGYGSQLDRGRSDERGTFDRVGPTFEARGYQQGRFVPSGQYGPRGYVSGDESSLKYSDRTYNPGFNSIYDRGADMPGGRFYGKGPKGYKRSDERIREEVCECLSNGHIDASEIEVTVQDGEVTLSGFVMDRRSKRLAEELLDDVRGVSDVDNKLKVKTLGGEDYGQKEKLPVETKKQDPKRAMA
jgi:hypothetical protein